MQYLIVLSLIAAVASAGYIKPTPVTAEMAEIQEIIAAINSPSTDPATAAALEQLLLQTLGLPEGPAPIDVGPAFIDFPVPDGGELTPGLVPVAPEAPAVVPAPVVVGEIAAEAAAPLVQIILNIQSAPGGVVAGAPAAAAPVEAADPVSVVDQALNPPTVVPTPVQVVDVAPVQVADVVPEPVHVAEPAPAPAPIAPEPIQIGEPIVPAPVVVLPDILN